VTSGHAGGELQVSLANVELNQEVKTCSKHSERDFEATHKEKNGRSKGNRKNKNSRVIFKNAKKTSCLSPSTILGHINSCTRPDQGTPSLLACLKEGLLANIQGRA